MKPFITLLCAAWVGLVTAPQLAADIEVRLSVKFILDSAGNRPPGMYGTPSGFEQEITRANQVLAATGRGYSLDVVQYLDIQPPAPVAPTVNRTCGTTDGEPMVSCSNTSGIQDCMLISGPGIPANTFVLSVGFNSLTLSNNATATDSSAGLTARFSPDTWFLIPARAKRREIEDAALADQETWEWSSGVINLFVNSSSSGQCTFVGTGHAISFGDNFGAGTVLHEIGHYFDLRHTHGGDYDDQPPNNLDDPPVPFVFQLEHLTDGDSLAETARDNPNINTRNELSNAHFNEDFADLSTSEKAIINSAFDNVMSYHQEDVLLSDQLDIWTKNANGARLPSVNGRTWFVTSGVFDLFNSGAEASSPFATIQRALDVSTDPDNVILLRAGEHVPPAGGIISAPCTLRATRGNVIIRP